MDEKIKEQNEVDEKKYIKQVEVYKKIMEKK